MRINNNITALNSHRNYSKNVSRIGRVTERLSSGHRINRAADDSAGLAISEGMRAQIRGLRRASLNAQDGISLLQVADGALQHIHDKLHRMNELAIQAATDVNTVEERLVIQMEIAQLTSEINDAISRTEFNERTLFDGSVGASWDWHLGLMRQAMDNSPAAITAGQAFDPLTIVPFGPPLNITSGTTLNTVASGNNLRAMIADNAFPREGHLIVQINVPNRGNFSVVVDFGTLNPDGDLTLDGLNEYFDNAFSNPPNMGGGVLSIFLSLLME